MSIDDFLVALDDKMVRDKIYHVIKEMDKSKNLTLNMITNDLQLEIKSKNDAIFHLQEENKKLKSLVKKIKELYTKNYHSKQQTEEAMADLEYQLVEKNKDISTLKENYDDTAKKHEGILQGNAQTLKKLDYYRDSFSDDLKIKEIYQGLSEKTKRSLLGIFKDNSVTGLVACGIQDKNISNLWDYAKNEVVHGTNRDQEAIIQLFELLFARFTLAYPMLSLQRPNTKDVFDPHKHIKHNSSHNMSGGIQRVLLSGYVNNNTNKVIKLAVVAL